MCGIVGYIGKRDVVNVLKEGLKKLEYRGYDSAGIAVFDGQEIQIKDAETANQYGISFIHQELALFPELSIATNIFIQHLPSAHGVVKKREMHAKAAELLAEFGLAHCHPEQTVGTLQIGEQQLVEIMRCLAMDTKILVLDEGQGRVHRIYLPPAGRAV